MVPSPKIMTVRSWVVTAPAGRERTPMNRVVAKAMLSKLRKHRGGKRLVRTSYSFRCYVVFMLSISTASALSINDEGERSRSMDR